MKAKMILGLAAALMFTCTSVAQKGEKKKDWNPEERVEKKVEKFAQKHELTEAQSDALKKTLLEDQKEIRAMKEAEKKRRKELHEKQMAKRQERVKEALKDDELTEAWVEFEKQEHKEMKEKRKEHGPAHHKRGAHPAK